MADILAAGGRPLLEFIHTVHVAMNTIVFPPASSAERSCMGDLIHSVRLQVVCDYGDCFSSLVLH